MSEQWCRYKVEMIRPSDYSGEPDPVFSVLADSDTDALRKARASAGLADLDTKYARFNIVEITAP